MASNLQKNATKQSPIFVTAVSMTPLCMSQLVDITAVPMTHHSSVIDTAM
jgi:hypothetical protein